MCTKRRIVHKACFLAFAFNMVLSLSFVVLLIKLMSITARSAKGRRRRRRRGRRGETKKVFFSELF